MICGQNLNMDALMSQVTSIKAKLLSGLDLDASALKSQMTADLDSMLSKLRDLVPELPTIPAVSLQTEISDLLSMQIGSPDYISKLASIQTKFGDALTKAGKDLTSLVSGLSSADICKDIPNMELPSGSTEVVEKAMGTLQAQAASLQEELSEFSDSQTIADLKAELEATDAEIKGHLAAWAAELESDTSTTVT